MTTKIKWLHRGLALGALFPLAVFAGSIVGRRPSSRNRACCTALRSTLMHSAAMMRPDALRKYVLEPRSSRPSLVKPR